MKKVKIHGNTKRTHLRSAERGDLTVPRTKTRRFGPRSFRVSGSLELYSVPEDIRIPELSLERFKSMLKTHLFRQAYALHRSQRFRDLVWGRLRSVSYIYIYIYINPSRSKEFYTLVRPTGGGV